MLELDLNSSKFVQIWFKIERLLNIYVEINLNIFYAARVQLVLEYT